MYVYIYIYIYIDVYYDILNTVYHMLHMQGLAEHEGSSGTDNRHI